MKRRQSKISVLVVMAACLSTNPCSFVDDMESRTLSTLKVNGNEAYIKKSAYNRSAAVADLSLGKGNQVPAGKASSTYIKADDDKAMELDNSTSVDVKKVSAKLLRLTLKEGKLSFNVEKSLSEGEELQFKAGRTSMGTRGTNGVTRYHPDVLCYYLIEGKVLAELGSDQSLEPYASQKAGLVRDWGEGTLGPGSEAGYVLRENGISHWTKLDTTTLKTVLKNREHLDLDMIGLNFQGELEQAESILEEQKRLKQTVKEPSHTYNGDGD